MARFLFCAWPYSGCIFPQISLAQALRSAGHEVAFYTGARMAQLLTDEALLHFRFGSSLESQIESLLLSPDGMSRRWQRPWSRISTLRTFLCDTVPLQVSDLNSIIDTWQPSALVAEPAMYAPFLILHELRGIPVVVLEYSFCMLPGAGIPPLGLGLPSPRNWYTRVQSRLGQTAVQLGGRTIRMAANALREQYQLARLNPPIAVLRRSLPLTLVPSSPEFDFNRTGLPASVQYVGACLWYPRESTSSDWLSDLPQDRPWVHVTEGTLYSQTPRVLRAAVRGLGGLHLQVIMSTGRQRESGLELGPLPENVVVKDWISYPQLLPRTRIVVTIGGGGTVLGALAHGVPLVIVPTMWDHADNAQRVVEAGAGIRLSPRECTPSRLRDAVLRVLNDDSYRQSAQRMAKSLQRYDGPERAAQLLAQIAQRPASLAEAV